METENFSSRQVFEKKQLKSLKTAFLSFLKTCRTKHRRARTIAIDRNLELTFALSNELKAKLIACTFKVGSGFMSRSAREKETHYGGL